MTPHNTLPQRLAGKLGSLAALVAAPLALQLMAPALTYAECPEGGYPQPCETDPSRRVCDESLCPPAPPPQIRGVANPKYLVTTLVYAAPGSKDCERPGTVSYTSASTLGSSVTVKDSFKAETKASVSVSLGNPVVASVTAGVSFGRDENETDTAAIDVSSTSGLSVESFSVCADGIDHDWDYFRILLEPRFDVTLVEDRVSLKPSDEPVRVQRVTDGELKGGLGAMNEGMREAAQQYGLTQADFDTILSLNPWSFDANAPVDSARFRYQTTLVYSNQDGPGGMTPSEGAQYIEGRKDSNSRETSMAYTVGVRFEGGGGFGPLFSAKLEASQSWTWTTSSTTAGSVENRNSAMLDIGVPSPDYTGPIMMEVYYDTVFRSFVAVPVR